MPSQFETKPITWDPLAEQLFYTRAAVKALNKETCLTWHLAKHRRWNQSSNHLKHDWGVCYIHKNRDDEVSQIRTWFDQPPGLMLLIFVFRMIIPRINIVDVITGIRTAKVWMNESCSMNFVFSNCFRRQSFYSKMLNTIRSGFAWLRATDTFRWYNVNKIRVKWLWDRTFGISPFWNWSDNLNRSVVPVCSFRMTSKTKRTKLNNQ